MLFQNKIQTKPRTNIQHRPATLIDRPSTFYDRVVAQEFRKKFVFDYPSKEPIKDEITDMDKKAKNTQLIKKIGFIKKKH